MRPRSSFLFHVNEQPPDGHVSYTPHDRCRPTLPLRQRSIPPGLGTDGMQMLIWCFFVSTVVLAHGTFTVNSLTHIYGTRRFETSDGSRNNWFVALITLGEGWHNNHQHYQATVRQGFAWWEIDITYYLLKAMSWVGLIWELKPIPGKVLDEMQPSKEKVAV